MKKKVLILALAAILLTGSLVYAEEIIDVLNIGTLVDTITENHRSVEVKKLDLENQKIALTDANKEAEKTVYNGGDRTIYIQRMKDIKMGPLKANLNVKLAEMAIIKAQDDLKFNVYEKGMKYLLLESEIALNEKLLEFKKIYQSNVEAKIAIGNATNNDLSAMIVDVQNQEKKVTDLKSSKVSLAIEVNHVLEKDLTAPVAIKDTLVLLPFDQYDIDTVYIERKANYPAVMTQETNFEEKDFIFELYKDRYLITDKEYQKAQYDRAIAIIERDDAFKSYQLALRKSYNSYVSAHESYMLAVKQAEISTKLYEESNIKFGLGVISKETLIKAEETQLNSDFAVKQAMFNYNVAQLNFRNLK